MDTLAIALAAAQLDDAKTNAAQDALAAHQARMTALRAQMTATIGNGGQR